MNRKTMVPVDSAAIKARMKELKYTYRDIEKKSMGRITEIQLKHFLNKGTKAEEAALDILAELLECSKEALIDKGYLPFTNLSFENNKVVQNLYLRNREDINSHYSMEIKNFRTIIDLKRMLDEAHRLFLVIASDDYIFDKTAFVKAYNIISREFAADNCIASRELTEIRDDEARSLYSEITAVSGEYRTQQVLLMFLYVFILFDAIFMEEAVASVTQLVPERKTEKANQFYNLAYRTEKMRNALIELVLYKRFQFDAPEIAECGIDDTVIEGIVLMLAACEQCYQHIHGNYVDSEYINRASFSAVLTKLEKIFTELEIPLPDDFVFVQYAKMNTNRFGRHYNMLKEVFKALNPPRKPVDKYNQGACDMLVLTQMFSNSFS
jgi:hypothetical protein